MVKMNLPGATVVAIISKVIWKKGFGPRETQAALGISRDSKDFKDSKCSESLLANVWIT